MNDIKTVSAFQIALNQTSPNNYATLINEFNPQDLYAIFQQSDSALPTISSSSLNQELIKNLITCLGILKKDQNENDYETIFQPTAPQKKNWFNCIFTLENGGGDFFQQFGTQLFKVHSFIAEIFSNLPHECYSEILAVKPAIFQNQHDLALVLNLMPRSADRVYLLAELNCHKNRRVSIEELLDIIVSDKSLSLLDRQAVLKQFNPPILSTISELIIPEEKKRQRLIQILNILPATDLPELFRKAIYFCNSFNKFIDVIDGIESNEKRMHLLLEMRNQMPGIPNHKLLKTTLALLPPEKIRESLNHWDPIVLLKTIADLPSQQDQKNVMTHLPEKYETFFRGIVNLNQTPTSGPKLFLFHRPNNKLTRAEANTRVHSLKPKFNGR